MNLAPRRVPSLGSRGRRRVMRTLFTLQSDGSVQLLADARYVREVLRELVDSSTCSPELRDAAARALQDDHSPRRFVWLQNILDREAAGAVDSDADRIFDTAPRSLVRSEAYPPAPLILYLEELRSPFNAGNIIRSAAAFGITAVVLSDGCPPLDHPRLQRAAMGATELVSCRGGTLDDAIGLLSDAADLENDETENGGVRVYALETGGAPLLELPVVLPAVVVVGHEQYGVSPITLELAHCSGGVLTIPHGGPKRSLNVGVAAGILLYHAVRG